MRRMNLDAHEVAISIIIGGGEEGSPRISLNLTDKSAAISSRETASRETMELY